MTEFVESPVYDNWLGNQTIKSSLIICTPYIKKRAVQRIIDRYLQKENEYDIEIMIRGTLSDFLHGSSDIEAIELLKHYIPSGKIRRLTNLHMKAYLFDNEKVLIGSCNCTNRGLFTSQTKYNIEGAIVTDDETAIKNFLDYYYRIREASASLDDFYADLVEEYNEYCMNDADKNDNRYEANEAEMSQQYLFDGTEINNLIQDETSIESSKCEADVKIPKINSFRGGAYVVPALLREVGSGQYNMTEIGVWMSDKHKEVSADAKFGELNVKLAIVLGFAYEAQGKIWLSEIGNAFLDAKDEQKLNILKHQLLRTEIVREIIAECHCCEEFDLEKYIIDKGYTNSESEAKRRYAQTIRTFFRILYKLNVKDAEVVCSKIYKRKTYDKGDIWEELNN